VRVAMRIDVERQQPYLH